MKILITGGAGYIGSHTIIELLNAGFQVISADNYSNSTPETFARIKKITGVEVRNYNLDLTDEQQCAEIFEKEENIAGVIHFAALKAVGESVEKPLKYYRNNLNSLINLLGCCGKYSVENFIFSSSCTVYGDIKNLPVNEETPIQMPASPYGMTKLAGEEIVEDYVDSSEEFSALSLRYFNPVGAHHSGEIGELPLGKPNNLVPIITQTAVGQMEQMNVHGNDYETRDGTCIRDYVHVTDIAEAHVLALQYLIERKNNKAYDVFNLGSGTGASVLEILNAFENVTGEKLNYSIGPRRPGDVEAVYSDSTKAEKAFGWKPKFDIDEMMRSAWKWQQNLIELESS